MTERTISLGLVLSLLFSAIFLAMVVAVMLGPLLVELAEDFNTSVAVAGQLSTATALSWAITAPLVGPVSDTYGRRPVLLMGLALMAMGILGSVLAWNFGSLLVFRVITGVGGAMVPPTILAVVADTFPPERRGKVMGWVGSSINAGIGFGVPISAFLSGVGGWRMPFYVIGSLLLVLWVLLWVWFPKSQHPQGRSFAFFSHLRGASSSRVFWYLLAANSLHIAAYAGMIVYLAAYLIQTYNLETGATVLPLTMVAIGLVMGALIGGQMAGHIRRLALTTVVTLVSGPVAVLVFNVSVPLWAAVALAFGASILLSMPTPFRATLMTELAGQSRATAAGMFAVSNNLGLVLGSSIGGLTLALGGFSLVGMFCLGAAVLAGLVMVLKVRDSAEFLERVALRKT